MSAPTTAPGRALLLAVDQGTSSTKALLVDAGGRVVARASAPLAQTTPRPGWVEQSAEQVWEGVRAAVDAALRLVPGAAVAGVALSVQRESLVLWERATGRPVAPLVSWQDQRTQHLVEELRAAGHGRRVQDLSGLPLDSMFSAAKARWLLDHHDADRSRSRAGQLCLGTVDAWLLWCLTGQHASEVGCASRTQLLDVRAGAWSEELLDVFDVPAEVLPRVVASDGPFAAVRGLNPAVDGAPVLAVLGDSHAALHARAGWRQGTVKVTYGTGSSVMLVAPDDLDAAAVAASGLCLTAAWQLAGAAGPTLALEANIRSAGRTMTWLADLLGASADDLWREAAGASADGVHVVPAFGGLAAPWWDGRARAAVVGLDLATGRPQLARAVLESVAFQVDDVLRAADDLGLPAREVLADGGATRSRALLELQADLAGVPVAAAPSPELSALGAAHLAGRAAGWWDVAQLERAAGQQAGGALCVPRRDAEWREAARAGWREALHRVSAGAPGAG